MIPLLLSRTTYSSYSTDTRPPSLLLTPAVVALAVPLGCVVGTLTSVGVSLLGGRLIGAPHDVRLALSTDSVTSPVTYTISERLGGAPPLAAAFVIIVGLLGATLLPGLLTRLGMTSRMARVMALGAVAHGIGTARTRDDSDLSGAGASVGMCLGALVVTLVSAFL